MIKYLRIDISPSTCFKFQTKKWSDENLWGAIMIKIKISPIPSSKIVFCCFTFDWKNLLFINNTDKVYNEISLIPSEFFCFFEWRGLSGLKYIDNDEDDDNDDAPYYYYSIPLKVTKMSRGFSAYRIAKINFLVLTFGTMTQTNFLKRISLPNVF